MTVIKHLSTAAVSAVLLASGAAGLRAADVTPEGYNTPIPVDVLTPDSVTTRVGTFNYFDGFPDDATMGEGTPPGGSGPGRADVPEFHARSIA